MLNDGRLKTDEENANLISSLLEDGNHAPVIDLDFPVRLEPSSTKGHHHLYIDKSITWKQYRHLLKGFYKAGLMEWKAYVRAIQRGQTFVRKPGVIKDTKTEVSKAKYIFTYFKVFCVAYVKLIWWNLKEFLSLK